MEKIIIKETEFNKIKDKVKKNKKSEIIFSSNDDELIRKVMEKLPINGILISLENRKDYSKQRNSGFNEVMAKIAKKNKINLYFSFEEIINSKNKERIIARIIQNIELCNRNKIQVKISFDKEKRNEKEIKSVLSSFGAPTWMTKNCI